MPRLNGSNATREIKASCPGEALGLSPRTLETYKNRGMAKLELQNRADIVRFALQQGWLKDA